MISKLIKEEESPSGSESATPYCSLDYLWDMFLTSRALQCGSNCVSTFSLALDCLRFWTIESFPSIDQPTGSIFLSYGNRGKYEFPIGFLHVGGLLLLWFNFEWTFLFMFSWTCGFILVHCSHPSTSSSSFFIVILIIRRVEVWEEPVDQSNDTIRNLEFLTK